MFCYDSDSIKKFLFLLERKRQLYQLQTQSPVTTIYCNSKGLDWRIEVGEQMISRASSPSNNQLWASY